MTSLLSLIVVASCLGMSHGMQCSWGEQNALSKFFSECPGIGDPSENSYCCVTYEGKPKCCNLLEFALTYIIIGVVILAILSILCCIISCFCCPCCFCYKRRHGNPI